MRRHALLIFTALALGCMPAPNACGENEKFSLNQSHWTHPEYKQLAPRVIAVLPMDNYSLETALETTLNDQVYNRLSAKGYSKVSHQHVQSVMADLGIQTPGQLAAVSTPDLCRKLHCDALLEGEINQSAAIHQGVYDAMVVSCSLRLKDCRNVVLWETEQWRTAHRQWNLDPINLLANIVHHEKASREDRIAFLVEQMLTTLPQGPIRIHTDGLLEKATITIQATPQDDDPQDE